MSRMTLDCAAAGAADQITADATTAGAPSTNIVASRHPLPIPNLRMCSVCLSVRRSPGTSKTSRNGDNGSSDLGVCDLRLCLVLGSYPAPFGPESVPDANDTRFGHREKTENGPLATSVLINPMSTPQGLSRQDTPGGSFNDSVGLGEVAKMLQWGIIERSLFGHLLVARQMRWKAVDWAFGPGASRCSRPSAAPL